jgi:uncharacterized membrane protein YfcA
VVSTGPITVPIFLSYRLAKGAFIGTEPAGSLAVYLSKAIVFHHFSALPVAVMLKELMVGSLLMGGSVLSKRLVPNLDPNMFRLLMDGLMLISGTSYCGLPLRRLYRGSVTYSIQHTGGK